jgi:hypothetical protein
VACGDLSAAYVVKSGSKLLHSRLVVGFGLPDLIEVVAGREGEELACGVARRISCATVAWLVVIAARRTS